MELLLMIGAVLLLDLLAIWFGVDSRRLHLSDRAAQHELRQLASLDRFVRPMLLRPRPASIRVRLAQALRTLAVFIAPKEAVSHSASRR